MRMAELMSFYGGLTVADYEQLTVGQLQALVGMRDRVLAERRSADG